MVFMRGCQRGGKNANTTGCYSRKITGITPRQATGAGGMKGLLAKLAAAPEGSEEQDIEIYRAVYAEPAKHRRYPRYTTSVDDQLPWENIWQVLRWEGEWSAWHANPKTFRNTEGHGHTEALARRVAALKAWDAGADNFGITTPRPGPPWGWRWTAWTRKSAPR